MFRKPYRIRRPIVILAVFAILSSLSCTRELEESQTIIRQGILYPIGSDRPFTGFVTGKSKREDYRTQSVAFKKEYKNGKQDGSSYFWYENGKIESVEPYKNGLIDGMVTRYYPNGRTKARIHFSEGMRGGSQGEIFWNANGDKIRG